MQSFIAMCKDTSPKVVQQTTIYHETAEHLLGPRCALALFYRVAGGVLPEGHSLQLWQRLQCVCLIYTSEPFPADFNTDVQKPVWSTHAYEYNVHVESQIFEEWGK